MAPMNPLRIKHARYALPISLLLAARLAAAALAPAEDAEGRVRMALQIARERNDRALVAEVEKIGRQVAEGLKLGKWDGLEAMLREIEGRVGIDPGGWSMAGQPLFHPTPEMLAKSKAFGVKLAEAMKSDDPARVRAVTAGMLAVLGDQAGVPDGRRPGRKSGARSLNEAEATELFLGALASQGRHVRQFMEARPLPDRMLRFYADLLEATTTVRPSIVKLRPERIPDLDKLARGLATILTKLQQPAGHFPFPDLRGKNIRFGAMLDSQVAAGDAEVREGWLISVVLDGGSQFDTGVCGSALLLAGARHGNDAWKLAGLRAADWALGQPCCANFNYTAFSVSLLAQAWRVSGEAKYLNGALKKFRVGIAPGQAPNGRWIDAHNARTAYHLIILRALGDLATALPADRKAERAEVDQVTRPAVKALLDEFDAMGHTVEALPELQTLANLYPDDARLRGAVGSMAAEIVARCTDGMRFKMGTQPNQLAALVK